MTTEGLKKDDLVRVHPRHQTAVHRSTELGRVAEIKLDTRFPVHVQFKTHLALFQGHELEKV